MNIYKIKELLLEGTDNKTLLAIIRIALEELEKREEKEAEK